MKEGNYKLLKSYLEKNWKSCEIIMFNVNRDENGLVPWDTREKGKTNGSGFILQCHIDNILNHPKG